MQKIKRKIFNIIQPADGSSLSSKIFDLIIMILILLSIISIFVMTFPSAAKWQGALLKLEIFSVIVFTVEYLLRFWTADMLYPQMPPWRARIRYMFTGMAIIDLAAIMPFYLPLFLPINLLSLRTFRLVRLLRVFKFNRYSNALSNIGRVFKNKSGEIGVSLFCISILLIISSLLIYHVEHEAQPDKFENAFSGLWWAVATLTTVGYGDIYPVTALGKIIGALMALFGIGLVAIPTGILSAGFIETLGKKEENSCGDFCPHCGKKIR